MNGGIRTVLHVVGVNLWDPELHFLGSTKDIVGRREYFEARGIECQELQVPHRDDATCLEMLQAMDLAPIDAILFEHPRYPATMKWLKANHRRILRVIRGHNAELLHHRQIARAYDECGFGNIEWRERQSSRSRERAIKRYRQDKGSARYADVILAISDWEARYYWRRLRPFGRIVSAPYFVPRSYEVERVPEDRVEKRCVCLMSAAWTPLVHDAAKNFVTVLRAIAPKHMRGWSFAITGDPVYPAARKLLAKGARAELLGLIDDPFELMRHSRALAVLSDYGMGFKTKILDVAQTGGYVFVTKKLARRIPKELAAYCIVVDPLTPGAFLRALERAEEPLRKDDANGLLRERAFRAMDRAFGVAAEVRLAS